jgi:hypothetical protein
MSSVVPPFQESGEDRVSYPERSRSKSQFEKLQAKNRQIGDRKNPARDLVKRRRAEDEKRIARQHGEIFIGDDS